MKRIVLLISLYGGCVLLYSQNGVGINTSFPKGTFHVDGGKDNSNTPTSSMQDNDFIIKGDGKIGIGIDDPVIKLHISSLTFGQGFRLVDGTQGSGKLLSTVNSQGDIKWIDRISTKIIGSDGVGYSGPVNSDMAYINRKITLEPGKWFIRSNILIFANSDATINKDFYAHFSWTEFDGTNYFLTPDSPSGNEFGGPYMLRYGIASGTVLINNTSTSPKTYYLVTRTPIFWGGYDPSITWREVGG